MKEFNRMFKMLDVFELVAEFLFFMAIIGAVAYGCTGCTSSPDCIYIDKTVWVYVTNRVDQAVEKHNSDSATEGSGRVTGASSGAVSESDSTSAAAGNSGGGETTAGSTPVAAVSLDWKYGSFNGSKAAEDPSCQITSISVSSKGVTFKFSGGSWWGATHDNPTMRCCAFYKTDSGKWVGGFWEWGSPDRKYRAFTNINDGYKGWDAKAFNSAKKHLFVICSKDGKKRSNFIED